MPQIIPPPIKPRFCTITSTHARTPRTAEEAAKGYTMTLPSSNDDGDDDKRRTRKRTRTRTRTRAAAAVHAIAKTVPRAKRVPIRKLRLSAWYCLRRNLNSRGGGGGQRKDKRGDAPRARYGTYYLPTNPNDHFFYFMLTMAHDHDDDDGKLPAASVGEEDDSDVEMEGE
jgi:hypothetical protein